MSKQPVSMTKIPNEKFIFEIVYDDGTFDRMKLAGVQISKMKKRILDVDKGNQSSIINVDSQNNSIQDNLNESMADRISVHPDVHSGSQPSGIVSDKKQITPPKRGARPGDYPKSNDDSFVKLKQHLSSDFSVAWKFKDSVETFISQGWDVVQFCEIENGERIASVSGKGLNSPVTRQDLTLMMIHNDGVKILNENTRKKYFDPLNNSFQSMQMEQVLGKKGSQSVYFPDGGVRIT